nr:sigma-70 family RNA polymerase sigma factor [Planococcus sp. 107-1]
MKTIHPANTIRLKISGAASPEKHLTDQAIKESLAQAIDRLPEKEKLVVSLCYFEELKLTEIAEVLSVSVSACHNCIQKRFCVCVQQRLLYTIIIRNSLEGQGDPDGMVIN